MRLLVALLFLCCAQHHVAHAQIKNSGIKTHYPGSSTGNLVLGNATEQHHYNYSSESGSASTYNYGGSYVPAETYQGGGSWQSGSSFQQGIGHYITAHPTRAPVFLDATAQFINETRASMATGICHKEVPTFSLVRGDPNMVPAGNGTTPNMSKIQICCEGYERNPHVFTRCDPICKDDCPNGICTAPNTCVCIPGHVRNEEGRCISICPLGCGNGVCDAQGECQCKPGYQIEPIQRKYCVPSCEPACRFGKCVAPNKCACTEGYRLTAVGACEPVCDSCDNGRCIAPGRCQCNEGYSRTEGVCEPVCTGGCNRGRCIAPETCDCPHGFQLDATRRNCVAHCDQPCLNGVCDGPNSCACNTGYIQDELQRNICKPHCPQGCPNGFCTSPNFCVCKPGFIKSGIKGRQTCVAV